MARFLKSERVAKLGDDFAAISWERRGPKCLALGAILLFALLLRGWNLEFFDKLIFDEVHYVKAARILIGFEPHPGMEAWLSTSKLIAKSPDINFSHPPLGKFLIGAGMLTFGDTPLGWRGAMSWSHFVNANE